MAKNTDQLFQRAVEAHHRGAFKEAEEKYREILRLQPSHPDANHNLAVLAMSVNKTGEALNLFKAALYAKPEEEQFWLSYVDSLIQTENLKKARQILKQAKKRGIKSKELSVRKESLATTAKKKPTDNIRPSQYQASHLLTLYQNSQFEEAEKLARSMTEQVPQQQIAWKVLGAIFGQTGRPTEAVAAHQRAVMLSSQDPEAHNNLGISLQELARLDDAQASYLQAIELKPDYAAAHYNLGGAFKEQGKLEEAEASYRQAIRHKPNYVEAHNNLGIALKDQGKFEEAEASYKQAIILKPSYAEAHNNLGVTLTELGKLEEALVSLTKSMSLKPDYPDVYFNFGKTLSKQRFKSSRREFYQPILQLLSRGNFTRPRDIAVSILSLLGHDPKLRNILQAEYVLSGIQQASSLITRLHEVQLLHQLMRICPLPDLQFEELFVKIRNLLLRYLDEIEATPELTFFLSTLSLHCFVNEYVFPESNDEISLIVNLENKIAVNLNNSKQPEALEILCLASYRPLHQYEWCERLEGLCLSEEIRNRLIEEPLSEKEIAKAIPTMQTISNGISSKVKEQYEENPYPRWIKLAIPARAKSITSVCNELKLQLHSENIKKVTAPSILIAGCGTGQHSIETASRFSDCHVTAVDLSLASLAYAQRKSDEFQLTNLDYLQADILHLHQLDREFDIIETSGVLHHMDEPITGWKILTDLLRPGGLMRIGLYSELARRHIVAVRNELTSNTPNISSADIRMFRQSSKSSSDDNHKRLVTSDDFFSLSNLRDLVFHVQEHRFSLLQIKNCLYELGLEFCGFEVEDAVSNFRAANGQETDTYDLTIWHEYEKEHPNTFAGMYQFWCQKL